MTEPEWMAGCAGPETRRKQADFDGLVNYHASVCEGIYRRNGRVSDQPYLYVDCHTGPGMLEYEGERFPGSPLIAIRALQSRVLPARTVHFETDMTRFDLASSAIHAADSSSWVSLQPFERGLFNLGRDIGPQEWMNGLIYSDPSRGRIPVGTFNEIARLWPRVDFLAYVFANQHYKRVGRRLAEDVHAVNKKHVLIRELAGAMETTFILWSDFPFGEWRARGFHLLSSSRGQRELARATYSAGEQVALFNQPLFQEGDDVLPAASP